MPGMWWQSSTVSCHFCSHKLVLISPSTDAKGKGRASEGACAVGIKRDFWCGECGCWNRRNEKSEFINDPASHNSSLNTDSFSKRASSGPSHLPPSFSSTPFCRTCLANQSLQVHLLASFSGYDSDSNSDSDDPPTPSRRTRLKGKTNNLVPDYKRSLDSRYPILCADCAPAVEMAIRERDYRAKAKALGWRLKASNVTRKGKSGEGRRRRRDGWKWWLLGVLWRLRGALWFSTHVLGIFGTTYLCLARGLPLSSFESLPAPSNSVARILASPITAFSSFLWIFWDPNWERARKERVRGRKVDNGSRKVFLIVQGLSWTIRLALSILYLFNIANERLKHQAYALSLFLLVLLFTVSLKLMGTDRPSVAILLRPSNYNLSSSLSSSPIDGPIEPLASLSISPFSFTNHSSLHPSSSTKLRRRELANNTIPQPKFGVPAFSLTNQEAEYDPDTAMDWDAEPLNTTTRSRNEFGLGQQRFFPTKDTGLEGMFKTRLNVEEKSWWKKARERVMSF